MKFAYVSGHRSLDFAGTVKHRGSPAAEEVLSHPGLLSEWAVEAGLLDAAIDAADDDLAAAIALREAIYRTVIARLEHRRPPRADVDLLNEQASQPQLTPTLQPDGTVCRQGTVAELLSTLAADVLDLLAGPDIDSVKRCADPGCTRLYVDSSRGKNRHWCGMATCGNRAKVQAFRARQRVSSR